MWNEFEHVEDDRFDPNLDGYYGEYKGYDPHKYDIDYDDEHVKEETRRKRWYEK